jgi:soluble lytic murein transglycosylase
MRTGIRIAVLAAWLAALGTWAQPARAHELAEPVITANALLSAQDRKAYRAAFHKVDKKRYPSARKLAKKAKERLPAKVIQWLALSAERPHAGFAEIARFLERNPGWPGQGALRRNAEMAMPEDLPDERLRAWFAARSPVTPAGALRYADALMRAGEQARATELLRAAWIERDFGRRDERAFRKRFAKLLRREHDLARLDRLLWDRKYRPAKRQARRLGKAYAALAEARIALARRAPGVDWAIRRVPAELETDPGLVYERARWRRHKNRYEGVIELLDPPNPAAPRPERWWPLRKWAARQALTQGDASVAYRIARAHGMAAGLGFAEGEWLAGWIALRFLKRPETAYEHFTRFNKGVSSPISLARSAFWAGQAARAMAPNDPKGDWPTTARRWYEEAARYGTTFYGQLASRRLGRPVAIDIPAPRPPDAQARAAFDRRELVRVVRMLGELGEAGLHERFLLRLLALARSADDYALVADLAHEQGRPDIAVRTAKAARKAGTILFDDLFPSPRIPEAKGSEPALVLAVIRQESAFYKGAVSRAGARGLMQLMPRTAKRVARRIKVRYSRKKLLTDPEYNLRLGRTYLTDLTAEYDGSYVLALAAYNAGPARANQWIKAFGDPRDPAIDTIDWIESIPFDETRNYVQRILESLIVYRRHLGVPDGDPLMPAAGPSFKSLAKSPETD